MTNEFRKIVLVLGMLMETFSPLLSRILLVKLLKKM